MLREMTTREVEEAKYADIILGVLKQHLRDMKVRYSEDARLKRWLAELAGVGALAVRLRASGSTSKSRRALASAKRQASLISEYARLREVKALESTVQAVLLASIRALVKAAT